MTTPAFRTWSRISRSEISSSEVPVTATASKSFCIRNKRIRGPGPIHFDAPGPAPFLHKILQGPVPLFAPGTWNQECGLPQQIRLHSADLAAGRGICGYLLQLSRELPQAGIIAFRAAFQPGCFVLKVFFARPDLLRRLWSRLPFRKDLYSP